MGMMERPMNRNCRSLFWYLVLVSFVLWSLLLYFHYSSMVISKNKVIIIGDNNTNIIVSRDFDSVHVHGNYGERIGELHDKGNIFGEGTGEFTEKVNDNNVGNDVGKKNENAPIDFFVDGVDVDQMMMNLGEELEPDIETLIEEESSNEVASIANRSETVDSLPVEGRRKKIAKQLKRENGVRVESDAESCSGKYIYVHHLPRRFNVDLLRDCRSLSEWTNMCVFTSNLGLGPHFANVEKVYSKTGWFATNQFMLEVIFHNRMKQYKCLTNDSSLASAIFVPYYAGIDVARYLWGSNPYLKDTDSLELVKWLRQKPEWKRMSGRDHFSVAGRITWDFRRSSNRVSDWGNKHFLLPETRKMTMLVIESSPWNNNDFAIPYPTYFHPSSDREVFQWHNRMRRQKRNFLFSFAGGGRPNISDSIRIEIMDQCRASRRKCSLLDCDDTANKCHNPVNVMKLFQNSIFCLQPPGDSFTRRSTFDSILAGCIPVFFHPGSAYVQYLWHLPKDYAKYSVFIPANQVTDGKVSIERVLSQIPTRKVIAMREEVIRLIPRVIYADPRSRLETLEDAFDITIRGVLERVETTRREMREGKNLPADITEELSWKYNLFGTLEEHEWDPFFVRTNDVNSH